jgi:outer membrane protein assembly factor BamB/orotate phosphoribosyltransferase
MLIETRQWLLEALRKRSVLLASQEATYSSKGSANSWMLDTRLLLVDPVAMEKIACLFWNRMKDSGDFQLACLEMTGIPLLIGIQAHGLKIGRSANGVIIRKERKANGRMRDIEGELNDLPIVFLDDIVNSGGSVVKAHISLKEHGRAISSVWALVDYGNEIGRARISEVGASILSEFKLSELGSLVLNKKQRAVIANPFRQKWRFRFSDRRYYHVVPKSTPAIDDERLYFGTDAGLFFALNQTDGSVRWKFDAKRSTPKGIFSSPIITRSVVIFGAYNGNVYALDCHSGDPHWQFQEADFVGSSPAIAEDLGIIAIGLEHTLRHQKGSVVGLDSLTGTRVWEFPTPDYVHASPLYVPFNQTFVVGSNDNAFASIDGATGHLQWMFHTKGAVKSRAALSTNGKVVIFGCFDHFIYALDATTGSLLWKARTEGIVYSEPLIIGDLAYVNSTDKQMYVLDITTGEVLNRWNASSKLFSSPVEILGKIYTGTNAGIFVEYDPKSDSVTGQCQLPERLTNKAVYNSTNKLFFVATNDNQVFALERT